MNWNTEPVGPGALAAFEAVASESEFPHTYSGQSWLAAFRIWKEYRDKPERLDAIGPYDSIPGVKLDGLGLSGFMVGWAMNAVRQMLHRKPGPNGSVVTVGARGAQPAVPALGPAEDDLKRVLGGGRRPRRK